MHLHEVSLAQSECLGAGCRKSETIDHELHAAGQLVEGSGIGGRIGDGLGCVHERVVQFSGFFRELVDMPGEFAALGALPFGIGKRAIGEQKSSNLLAHVFQLLP